MQIGKTSKLFSRMDREAFFWPQSFRHSSALPRTMLLISLYKHTIRICLTAPREVLYILFTVRSVSFFFIQLECNVSSPCVGAFSSLYIFPYVIM